MLHAETGMRPARQGTAAEKKAPQEIFDAIVARCGTRAACLKP
jgi:hypothetical protein